MATLYELTEEYRQLLDIDVYKRQLYDIWIIRAGASSFVSRCLNFPFPTTGRSVADNILQKIILWINNKMSFFIFQVYINTCVIVSIFSFM